MRGNPYLLYVALSVAFAIALMAGLGPLAGAVVEGWARRDVDAQARLVYRSLRDDLTTQLTGGERAALASTLESVAGEDNLSALGVCAPDGALIAATRRAPTQIGCADLPAQGSADALIRSEKGGRLYLSVFPIATPQGEARLFTIHEMAGVDARARRAAFYAIVALIAAALGLGAVAALVVSAMTRRWSRSITQAVAETPETSAPPPNDPIARRVHMLLADFRAPDLVHIDWSPATITRLLAEELPGSQVIVVSNREPYIHNATPDGVRVQRPASGLVAALEPVMRACGGVWIAHGGGSGDAETVDEHDRIAVPPDKPEYSLRRLWISEQEQEGYYYGFANEGLWPLCHIAFVRPIFRRHDWDLYKAINERFAEAVTQEATCADPIVLVHDYHLALVPSAIRRRLPRATIIAFWHIPWPNSETFSICPWREEIIEGLLGSDILGFHTQLHCNNFIDAVDRFMKSRIDRESSSVTLEEHETLVRPYPISIEWPPAALATQAPVAECRRVLRERLGMDADMRIAAGIERFDYTKGILDRIDAVDELLTRQPRWRGRFALVQAAAPTRSKLEAYSSLQAEVERRAAEVNAKHGEAGYLPVHLLVRHHEPEEVYELFRAADLCVVSSLHDGMNLVAKEFVAARDDEQGVLILSDFAGASRELTEALLVNPYDPEQMAETFARALEMSQEEQRSRMSLMRDVVRLRNVHRWAGEMLLDASWLRKRKAVIETP